MIPFSPLFSVTFEQFWREYSKNTKIAIDTNTIVDLIQIYNLYMVAKYYQNTKN